MSNNYGVYSKFDIDKHKEVFVNYLEVVILEDGTIEYAVPSHQEKLLDIISRRTGKSRKEIYDSVPKEYYCDVCTWLCNESRAVSVWNNFYIGEPNNNQIESLKELELRGLCKW